LGWGLTQKVVSWVAWEGEVWLFFKVGRWDFKNIIRNYSFGGVGWGVTKRERVRSTNGHPDKFNRPSIKPSF